MLTKSQGVLYSDKNNFILLIYVFLKNNVLDMYHIGGP